MVWSLSSITLIVLFVSGIFLFVRIWFAKTSLCNSSAQSHQKERRLSGADVIGNSCSEAAAVRPSAVSLSSSKSKKGPFKQTPSAIGSAHAASVDKGTSNPRYLNVLKGFSGDITCVCAHPSTDSIGVSCAGDRTVRIFDVSSHAKLHDVNPPYVRCTIEGDFVTAMDFTHDGSHLICAKDFSRSMIKIKIASNSETGKALSVVFDGGSALHKNTVRWLVASKGNWAVTCSEEDDTEVKLWSYGGDLLSSFNTKQVKNFQMAVSPSDGRFVCVAAWSPGVKIMEVLSKSKEFSKVDKAMDLKSPKGIKAVCVSPDNTRAFTVDKGGLLTLWNIAVRYQVHEDPKALLTCEETDPRFRNYTILAFTPDNKRIIGVADNHVKIMQADTPENCEVIEAAHQVRINTLAIALSGKLFVTGAADNRPRLWRL